MSARHLHPVASRHGRDGPLENPLPFGTYCVICFRFKFSIADTSLTAQWYGVNRGEHKVGGTTSSLIALPPGRLLGHCRCGPCGSGLSTTARFRHSLPCIPQWKLWGWKPPSGAIDSALQPCIWRSLIVPVRLATSSCPGTLRLHQDDLIDEESSKSGVNDQ